MNFFGRRLTVMSLFAIALFAVSATFGSFAYVGAQDRLRHLDNLLSGAVDLNGEISEQPSVSGIVFATGVATPEKPLLEEAFNLQISALKLMRESEIFQWVPWGKTYVEEWHHEPKQALWASERHRNTGTIAYPTRIQTADPIILKGKTAVKLDPAFAEFIGGDRKHFLSDADYERMPEEVRTRFQLVEGSLVEKSAAEGYPKIGDNRTRFRIVPPYEVTVVGHLKDGRVMTTDAAGVPVGILLPGRKSLDEIRDEISSNIIGDSIPRGVLSFLLWIGALSMFRKDFRNAPRVERPVEPLRLGR